MKVLGLPSRLEFDMADNNYNIKSPETFIHHLKKETDEFNAICLMLI